MKRREAKREAAKVARVLILQAAESALEDIDLAREQASLARRIMLKFNVRYEWSLRRFYCRGCKTFIFPGKNARVRLAGDGFLRITCQTCGHVNRKRLPKAGLNTEG